MDLKVFLDVLLIEEIPVVDSVSTGIVTAGGQEIIRSQRAARKPQTGKVVSCGESFPMNGHWVTNPYKVGDVVRTNEFGRDYLEADDDLSGKTKFYLIHYADVQGLVGA